MNDMGGLFGLAGTIGAGALMGPFGAAGAGAGSTLGAVLAVGPIGDVRSGRRHHALIFASKGSPAAHHPK